MAGIGSAFLATAGGSATSAQLATVALTTAGAGIGLQAFGMYQQGKAAESAAKSNAALAIRNAEIAAEEAKHARKIAGEEARERKKEGRSILAYQKTLYTDFKTGAGSPFLVREKSKKQLERQVRIISERGQYAYGRAMSERYIYLGQYGMFKKQGKSASRSAMWGAGTTLATGFSNLYLQKYYYDTSKKKETS